MMNEKMKLAKNIVDNPDMKPTRTGYGEGLVELGNKNKDVVVLCADLTDSTKTGMFLEKFPERFVEVGIAEQNMMNVAAGLALAGKIPFVSTYGVFCTGRAWDQMRTTVAYGNINVKIGGAHGGISVGPDGATHQSLEEIALTRVLPNMVVIVPTDAIETRKATVAAAQIDGPVFIRFGREAVPIITTEDTPFKVGRGEMFRDGKDATVVACGPMVREALVAAERLANEKIDVRVVNLHTVKPIDKDIIVKAAKETGAVVTAEEHQINAGFGGAVAEILGENCPVPMKRVGVMDRFGESGEPEELMEEFGLTSKEIVDAVKEVVKRK